MYLFRPKGSLSEFLVEESLKDVSCCRYGQGCRWDHLLWRLRLSLVVVAFLVRG